MKSVRVATYNVGHNDCDKDSTYHVLWKTIGAPLNASLRRMYCGEASVRLSIFQDNESLLYSLFGNANAGSHCVYSPNVCLFVTGDIVFYSIVLGKENMSGLGTMRATYNTSNGRKRDTRKAKNGPSRSLKPTV